MRPLYFMLPKLEDKFLLIKDTSDDEREWLLLQKMFDSTDCGHVGTREFMEFMEKISGKATMMMRANGKVEVIFSDDKDKATFLLRFAKSNDK